MILAAERKAPKALQFLGNAFAITPTGTMLTAWHCVDVKNAADQIIGVLDNKTRQFRPISQIRRAATLDLAILDCPTLATPVPWFPLLTPDALLLGEDVYTFGYYSIGGRTDDMTRGYFKGNIVNITKVAGANELTISFPIIEGLSGSPLLTYHNGVKLVGVNLGSSQSRIQAYETAETLAEGQRTIETIHRIVEMGKAYDSHTIAESLKTANVQGFLVSSERVQGLEIEN